MACTLLCSHSEGCCSVALSPFTGEAPIITAIIHNFSSFSKWNLIVLVKSSNLPVSKIHDLAGTRALATVPAVSHCAGFSSYAPCILRPCLIGAIWHISAYVFHWHFSWDWRTKHLFMVIVATPMIFFEKVSAQVFVHFHLWSVFNVELYQFSKHKCVLGTKPSSDSFGRYVLFLQAPLFLSW